MTEDVTPIRQQYLEIKRQYPNAILFFRLGDFYETFDQDAEIASRELDIVLTSRPIGKGLRAPLAGIPFHAVENYLSRLIEKGYHVAICEQVGSQPTKGIFPRKVVRVVSPGTIIEPGLLKGDTNNYLVSFVLENDRAGISYADITTGEFAVTELQMASVDSSNEVGESWGPIRAELSRLNAAEIIFPDNLIIPQGISGHFTARPAWHFDFGKSQDTLLAHFETSTLDGLGIKNLPLAIRAAGGIIQYLKESDGAVLALFDNLHVYSLNEFMTLDSATRRNLELTESLRGGLKGSLLGVLDQTVTPMGKRLVHQWISQPLLDGDRIRARQANVDFFFSRSMLRSELRSALKPFSDLERVVNRILSYHAQPRDLASLRESLQHLPNIINYFVGENTSQNFPINEMNPCLEEYALLQSGIEKDPPATLQNTGIIKSGYSAELDDVVEASRHARDWINDLEVKERERTGIKTLKVGYNKVFGYFIEISQGQAANAPPEYIRKQTLVNAERFITPEMKEYETLVLNAEERIHEIEQRLFREICEVLGKSSGRLLATAHGLAELDVYITLAEVAALEGYIRPEIISDDTLEIHDGRHPVVETSIQQGRYVPNDVIFEKGEIVRIITGPNMSGKSTYLRQAALIVLMAQIGSFVPATSARIGLVDRIFTRIGALDEIHAGQSTFMVEMIEAANIMHHATQRSLLILDEIGRGTSTYDGVSIAWAIVEYIHNHPSLRSKTLFATHYHELTQLADLLPGVHNYNVAVTEADGTVVFLHKIIPGGADRSYGIHVAQLAGLPRPVIQRAAEIMSGLEKSSGQAVRINPYAAQQVALFPETNPLLDELNDLDVNSLSPIEALNKLFEWQRQYFEKKE
jgi:DNA mismatch repair protein MutS